MSTSTAPTQQATSSTGGPDLAALYKHLRVVDVADALDGIGYFNLTLMSPELRPLWSGMRFWGPAVTMRAVPSNKPMWKLDSTQDIVEAHRIWFERYPATRLPDDLPANHVIVMESGGGPEVGFWGSENAMGAVGKGAAGIITDGYCRDTAEIELQRTPVVARRRGRTIIPGRIEVVEVQGTIACGGVRVDPGDVVGCDEDGAVVVPAAVAEEVAVHARAILLADMHARRRHYDAQGKKPDSTVDADAVIAYYESL
ncbi:RraA family protein [Streptomyces sp. NP160]|uniref:RraA family protein n=1 Tax=Streptomyces sp. NP160 TaxID=2586637 RepID=UPI001118E50C|nr:RraA family protein [Streptomyces sp. NP160]TNM69611.1 RraA family protein [Streptomyces sp. NP160]